MNEQIITSHEDTLEPVFRELPLSSYSDVHSQMRNFTDCRDADTHDEIWYLQHHPVFTLGRSGSKKHILRKSTIPIVQSDRGGDVTYHGPGQLIVYCLIDLKRLHCGVKNLVWGLEEIIIQYLFEFNVIGHRLNKAPGVYVNNKKVASLGLRVRNGCSFHGMAINVDMDLLPFQFIQPCGLQGMKATQLSNLGIHKSCSQVASSLTKLINRQFYK